jgi:hypothetical protein
MGIPLPNPEIAALITKYLLRFWECYTLDLGAPVCLSLRGNILMILGFFYSIHGIAV